MMNGAQIRGDLADPDYYAPNSALMDVSDPDYWTGQSETGVMPYYVGDTEGFFDFITEPVKAIGKAVSTVASPIVSAVKTIATPVLKVAETVASPVLKVVQPLAAAISQNPLFDIAKTGVSFIPGVGTAVSAGMGALAAAGRGQGLQDIALQAAKSAVPGGPAVQAALDVAVGALQGRDVAESVLSAIKQQLPGGEVAKAVFDAGTAIARGQAFDEAALNVLRKKLPGGTLGQQAFNAAIAQFRGAKAPQAVSFPAMRVGQQRIARQWQNLGMRGLQMPVRNVARTLGANVHDVRTMGSAFLNRWAGGPVTRPTSVGEAESLEQTADTMGIPVDTRDFESRDVGEMTFLKAKKFPKISLVLQPSFVQALYDKGTDPVRKAILAHGLLARLKHSTGELDGTGGWTIRSGDTGWAIAKKVTGDGNRWKEMIPVNPGMTTYTDSGGATQIKPWKIGQRVVLPPSWMGTAAPVPAALPIPTIALPQVIPASFPLPTAIPALPASAAAPRTYVVQSGDSLWKIAQKYTGNGGRWTELYAIAENKATIGADPNKLQIGQKLVIPVAWPGAQGAVLPQVLPAPIPLPAPGPAVPSTLPDPTIGAVQTMLAFFYSRHASEIPIGAFSSSNTVPFGTDPDDLGGLWDDRCVEAMRGFQGWSNAHPRPNTTPLPETGEPDQASVAALQAQNAADIAQMGGVPLPAPTPSVLPTPVPIPVLPAIPQPWSEQPSVQPAAGGAAPPVPSIPIAPGAKPPAAAPPAAKKGGDIGVLLALGLGLLLLGGGAGYAGGRRAA